MRLVYAYVWEEWGRKRSKFYEPRGKVYDDLLC